jgi:hypothetical protein
MNGLCKNELETVYTAVIQKSFKAQGGNHEQEIGTPMEAKKIEMIHAISHVDCSYI